MRYFFFTLIILVGCNCPPPQKERRVFISSRDHQMTYRAMVASDWIQIDPSTDLTDSTLPNATFLIGSPPHQLHLHVHTFPFEELDKRATPQMQVARWKQQLLEAHTTVRAVSHGGFSGLAFVALTSSQAMLAWSLHLDLRLISALWKQCSPPQARSSSADCTIKVVGKKEAVLEHQQQIESFVKSFELIEGIFYP